MAPDGGGRPWLTDPGPRAASGPRQAARPAAGRRGLGVPDPHTTSTAREPVRPVRPGQPNRVQATRRVVLWMAAGQLDDPAARDPPGEQGASRRPAREPPAHDPAVRGRQGRPAPDAQPTVASRRAHVASRGATGSRPSADRGAHRPDIAPVVRVGDRLAGPSAGRGARRSTVDPRIAEAGTARGEFVRIVRHAAPTSPGGTNRDHGRRSPTSAEAVRRGRTGVAHRPGAQPSEARRPGRVRGPARHTDPSRGRVRPRRSRRPICSDPRRSSSPAGARSRRSSPLGAPPTDSSSSRSGGTPSSNSSCTPRGCASRSSRSRAAR
jgi:hypothetical protein